MKNKVIKVDRLPGEKLVDSWIHFRNSNEAEWYQIVTLDNGKKYIDDYPGCGTNEFGVPRPRGEKAHNWSKYIGRRVVYELADCNPSSGNWEDSTIEKQWIRFVRVIV